MVEDAQRHMTDIIVKTENAKSKRRSIDELVSCNSLPKPEPDDDDEVPFNMLIEDVAIALGADDTLSHHEFSRDDDDQEKFESHNDVSLDFDGEAFMKNILTNKPKDTVDIDKEENDEAAAPMPEKRRRSSRNAIKSPDMTISSEENSENVGNIVRRGRPKKGHIVGKGNSKPKRRMDDPKKTADSDMYKIKMKEIDDQISQYMTLYCDVCNAAVNNFAGLRIHMREHGIGRGYAKCCNKKFLKRALLLDHIRQHLDPECYR